MAFESFASNLVPGDTNGTWDLFVRDRLIGSTQRVSLSDTCAQGNDESWQPALSADGHYVAFGSTATNLVPGDTNAHGRRLRDVPALLRVHPRQPPLPNGPAHLAGHVPGAAAGGLGRGGRSWGDLPRSAVRRAPCRGLGRPGAPYPSERSGERHEGGAATAGAGQVFCIGLSDAVANLVSRTAGPAATVTVIRGDGGSVYDMSYRVAKALGTKVGDMSGATAIVTIGGNFPDALGVSPLACANLWPILLTDSPGGAALNARAALALSELGITKTIKVGTYAALPPGVTYLANLSGTNRYVTNVNVANWAKENGGLVFTHTGLATGDKFPDALAAGPYLAKDGGILLLSPLTGPLPSNISALMAANRAEVRRFSYIAMIEPVVGQVKALLP